MLKGEEIKEDTSGNAHSHYTAVIMTNRWCGQKGIHASIVASALLVPGSNPFLVLLPRSRIASKLSLIVFFILVWKWDTVQLWEYWASVRIMGLTRLLGAPSLYCQPLAACTILRWHEVELWGPCRFTSNSERGIANRRLLNTTPLSGNWSTCMPWSVVSEVSKNIWSLEDLHEKM